MSPLRRALTRRLARGPFPASKGELMQRAHGGPDGALDLVETLPPGTFDSFDQVLRKAGPLIEALDRRGRRAVLTRAQRRALWAKLQKARFPAIPAELGPLPGVGLLPTRRYFDPADVVGSLLEALVEELLGKRVRRR